MSALNAKRILIAADSPTEALAVEGMLRGSGYVDVRITSDAREIGPLYAKWPFRVLLLDLNMSTLGGLNIVRAFGPYIMRGDLHVLALTNAANAASAQDALNAGARNVLLRPLAREDVLEHVASALAALAHPSADERSGRPYARRQFNAIS